MKPFMFIMTFIALLLDSKLKEVGIFDCVFVCVCLLLQHLPAQYKFSHSFDNPF